MGAKKKHGTGIEWTHGAGLKGETWNPVVGCSKVSTGCRGCYAEEVHRTRLNGVHGYPAFKPWTALNAAHNVTLMSGKLGQPLRWGKPRMVFVNSMSDLFHEQIPDGYIAQVFATMANADHHIFQVLTKRPERMRDLLGNRDWWADVREEASGLCVEAGTEDAPYLCEAQLDAIEEARALANAWLGVSIENRKWVGRADILRETPAAVRFISAEPLLGPLVHDGIAGPSGDPAAEDCYRDERGAFYRAAWIGGYRGPALALPGIDWLIIGGESGKGHRPLDVQWMRDLRDAARASGTAVFVKQLGGHRPGTALEDLPEDLRIREFPPPRVPVARP